MYLGEQINSIFLTESAAGQATDADSLPSVTLYRNGDVTTETVTVTNNGTGVYKYQFYIPGTWAVGDEVNVVILATIQTVAKSAQKAFGTILYSAAPSSSTPTITISTAIPTQSDFSEFIDMQGSFPYTSRLEPKCDEAQRADLRPILGPKFYDEVMEVVANSHVIASGTTFTQPNYELLKPYMVNYVKYAAYVRYLKDSGVTLTRYGAVKKKTPHSEPLEGEEKSRMINYYDGMARTYMRELTEFLDCNLTKYPLFDLSKVETVLNPHRRTFYSL